MVRYASFAGMAKTYRPHLPEQDLLLPLGADCRDAGHEGGEARCSVTRVFLLLLLAANKTVRAINGVRTPDEAYGRSL